MANDSINFFYWYKRYKVRAQDMTDFQQGMVDNSRGLGEGLMGASILKGFGVTPGGGLSLSVTPGIANAASGYLEVMNESVTLDVTNAAASGLPCRSLVVVTPNPTDSDFINSPNTPFTQVPLKQLQKSTVVLIQGTPGSSPDYPSKGPNDVILCGLVVPSNANAITSEMIDFEIRESIGVNSLIAQNQVRFDNRMRPYRSSPNILGIKPSQNVGSSPLCFSYPGRLTPSLFPLNAGAFNPIDTFINFKTGVISGGDTTTPSFSPTIPPANNSCVAVVSLTQKDTLNINFGDLTGSYAQCMAAIKNQLLSGPGSLPGPDGNFGIAYVILTSISGVLSDVQVFDGRPFLGSGAAAAKFQNETPTGTINGINNIFNLSKVPADPGSLSFYVDGNVLRTTDFSLAGAVVTITNPDFIPALGQTVYAKYLIYGAVSNNTSSDIQAARFKQEIPVGIVDGTNAMFALSSVPVDNDSIDFFVNQNKLETTDYSISGNEITITNPDVLPQPGQSVYAKYLFLGFIGGGGGAVSGYTPFGSKAVPVLVDPTAGIDPTSDPLQTWFLKAMSGATVVTANPQVGAGSSVGQVLKLKIANGVDYPVFQNGNGLSLSAMWPATGGTPVDSALELTWDGGAWSEDSRR